LKERRILKKDIPRICADAVGIAHFIVANAILVTGQVTSSLDSFGAILPGLRFVYTYLDFPVYYLVQQWAPAITASLTNQILFGELVITLSSGLYGIITMLIVALFIGDD